MTSITQRKSVDMEKEFPELWAWLQRVYARPAWKRGLEKAFGGVYDLTVFPKKPRL
jgi:glutathione S-transferase